MKEQEWKYLNHQEWKYLNQALIRNSYNYVKSIMPEVDRLYTELGWTPDKPIPEDQIEKLLELRTLFYNIQTDCNKAIKGIDNILE